LSHKTLPPTSRRRLRLPPGTAETFAAFRHPNYRYWAIGQFISSMGGWMQSTAQGYLIFQLTQSAAYLGYISFSAGVPVWFLTLYGGVIADRLPRRLMLFITQTAMMLTSLVLALLIFANLIQPWHVLAASFCLGIINAFDGPVRQVFVIELVGKEDLTNAIALNASIFHTATVMGPTVGGIIYALAGPAWCFTINALSFVAILIALLLIKLEPRERAPRKGTALGQLREGLNYTLHTEPIRTLLIDLTLTIMLGFSVVTLIPAWASEVLGGDVQTNGLLLSGRGVGALLGALMIAFLGSRRMRGRLLAWASFTLPLAMLVFALLRWIPMAVVFIGIIGWSLIVMANVTNALVQTAVPDEMRGRVMSLYMLVLNGGSPIGSLVAGSAAASLGAPAVILINALLLGAFAVYTWLRKPFIRKLS
jgi:predicted MFS family arabinose efflux permease